jgi:ABC-type Mn2+/Zn2+ transport system permease subunit
MRGFLLFGMLAGVMAVLLGVALSFEADLPLGAAVVAGGALTLLPGVLVRRRA